MSSTSVHGVVDKATDSKAFEYTARAGFAASGVLHLLVAFIILRLAFGSGGNADQSGALATLAGQPGGPVMLWVAAVGLLALGLWRVGEAVIGSKPGERSGQKQDDSPAWKRAKSLGLAIVNFAIAFSAARFAMGSGQSSSQQNAGTVRAADAVRLGQDPVDRGGAGRRGDRRLPRLQGRVEEVPQGPARAPAGRASPRSVLPATWPRASCSSAPGCSSSSRR